MTLLRAERFPVTWGPRRRLLTTLLAAGSVTVACGGNRAGPHGAPRAPSAPALTCDYTVRVGPDLTLTVDAAFSALGTAELAVDDAAMDFVEAVTAAEGAERKPVARDGGGYRVACAKACRVEYRFRLRDAATRLADVDTAIVLGGAVVAPPSTWLLRPVSTPAGPYRFKVETPPGVAFATGVRPSSESCGNEYQGDLSNIDESAFAAFGDLKILRVAKGIDAAVVKGVTLSDAEIASWLSSEVTAISDYLGRAPDDHAVIFLAPGTSEVNRGKTLGGGGAAVLVRVGTAVTAKALVDDWVVAHELVHVGFPVVGYQHAWFAEGLATYVEPVARARAGVVSREKFWGDLVEGLPQGLPGASNTGLDGTEEWGRVYWGGALYFLLADLTIRERTAGARSLDDAVRAVASTGANVETHWPLERVMDAGDRATGTTVLQELYAQYGVSPGKIELAALWAKLGIRQGKRSEPLAFENGAPWAGYRDAITARRSERISRPPRD